MADGPLRRRHRDGIATLAEQPLHRVELDLVAERRRGAVRVDVVEILRLDAGALQRRLHRAVGTIAALRRRGDMIGIARKTVADDLRIDARATRFGMVQRFEHDGAGALAHHEAVAIPVERARALRRLVVEARRQGATGAEAGDPDAVDGRFGAAGDHDFGIFKRDQSRRVADSMRPGRAGGHAGMVRPAQSMLDRHIAACKVDESSGDEERRYAPRTLLVQDDGLIGDAAKATDAGAEHHAGIGTLLVGLRMPAGVGESLGRGTHGEDDEVIDLALLLRLHPLVSIERAAAAVAARHHHGDATGKIVSLEPGDRGSAALAGQEALPRLLDAASERRNHAEACDNYPSHFLP